MAERELRLRLQVRRHGLPDVNLLWNAPAGPESTISNLVEKVNEVVPLESEDWGLEDYVVELKGPDGTAFECLHFQQVAKVLKDEDQVIIRSLLTDDIRIRRVSGRHQITIDGRHLVDGIAYGRRWLNAPRNRPPVALPPRKRARIEPADDYRDEDDGDAPLLLDFPPHSRRGGSRRASSVRFAPGYDDAEFAEEDEGDDEYDPGRPGSYDDPASSPDEYDEPGRGFHGRPLTRAELGVELERLRDEDSAHQMFADRPPRPDAPTPSTAARGGPLTRKRKAGPPLSSTGESSSNLSDSTFLTPSEPQSRSEAGSDGSDGRDGSDQDDTVIRHPRVYEAATLGSEASSIPSILREFNDSDASCGYDTVRHGGATNPRRDLDDSSDDSDDSSDESESGSASVDDSESESESESDEDSDSESSDDSGANHAADNPVPRKKAAEVKAGAKVSKSDSDSDDKSDTDSDSDSDSESSGDSEVEPTTAKPLKEKKAAADEDKASSSSDDSRSESSDSDSSDEESDSSSESDSEPDEVSSKPVVAHVTTLDKAPASKPEASAAKDTPVPPGQGLSKTKRRNLRRRLAKAAAGQTARPANTDTAASEAATAAEMAEFELRKQALLDLMHVDTPEKPKMGGKAKAATLAGAPTPYAPGSFPVSLDNTVHDKPKDAVKETSAGDDHTKPDAASASPTVQRRLKLNVDAGRRILFGALGFANPKNKAAEEKVRDKLMKDVRPLKNHRVEEDAPAAAEPAMEVDTPAVEEEDPDAWRKKINYRAVECCEDGIELSEPPFPFVQRWDPQQQGNFGKKKGKRKRAQQASAQHEEEAAAAAATSSKKHKAAGAHDESWATWDDSALDDTVLSYDDPPSMVAANESQLSDSDDLPALPADVTTLPALLPGAARPGMVVTYKHWRLGGQTSWGPELVDQTAVVVKTEGGDGSQIRLLLAKRDRESETAEKVYDEVTGQRIYGRFEVPDFEEDEEDEEDDGNAKSPDDWYRDVTFSELIEPRIVQQPPDSYSSKVEPLQNEAPPDDRVVQETQFEEMDVGAPTSAQPDTTERQSSSTETAKVGGEEQVSVRKQSEAPRSQTPDQRGRGPSERLLTNSPSRQLRETAAEQPLLSSKTDAASDGSQEVIPDSVPEASTDGGSIHSGRQPDPGFMGDDGGESPARLVDAADETSQDLTPKANPRGAGLEAKPAVSTPKRAPASSTPSSVMSLPTLDEVWNTATTSRHLGSLSKDGPESSVLKLKSEFSRGASGGLSTPKKNLFPNSTQPVKAASSFSPLDEKANPRLSNTKTRRTSGFTIPEGTQVVALSSDEEDVSSPAEEHADDGVDAGHKAKKTPQVKARTQKSGRQSAARGRGKAKDVVSRAASMPANARQVIRRSSMPATAMYGRGKNRAARRATGAAWDGEI